MQGILCGQDRDGADGSDKEPEEPSQMTLAL